MVDQITNTEPSEDVEQGDCTIPDISSLPVDDEALRRQIMSIGGHEVEGVAVLSFRALQLYRIAILQAELTRKQSVAMKQGRAGRADWKIIDELLQSYGE